MTNNVIKNINNTISLNQRLKAREDLTKKLRPTQVLTEFRSFEPLLGYAKVINAQQFDNLFNDKELNSIVEDFLEKNSYPIWLNDKGSIIPNEVAKDIIKNDIFISNDFSLYKYNTIFYECVDIRRYFQNKLDEYAPLKKDVSKRNIEEVGAQVMNLSEYTEITQTKGYIPFRNGLYSIEEGQLIDFTPSVKTFGTLDYDYIEGADIKGTEFEKFIINSLDESKIPFIQELIGYALSPNQEKAHKFCLLIGEGRNGKGVLMNLINEMVTNELVSNLSIQQYDQRFYPTQLQGKLVNICFDDQTTRLETVGNFKTVTAGEPILVENKGKDSYTIKPNVFHIGAFNTFPSMQEKNNAIWDRMLLLKFNTTFGTVEEVERGEKDKVQKVGLLDILRKELPIITSWAVKGRMRLENNGFKFSVTEDMREDKQEQRLELDPIRLWIKESVIPCVDVKNANAPTVRELYEHFKQFCEDEYITAVPHLKTFKQIVKHELRRSEHKYNNKTVYKVRLGNDNTER